ncbi:MAG TPA: HD-GYP domain-containing protein [Gemmatimonadaceae bacterium]|nr:HD-GYP domain-containing protein [Gemmatimonadaceae bacterium]
MNERIRKYVAAIAGASIASAVAVFAFVGVGTPEQLRAAGFFALLMLLAHLLRYEGSRSGATGSVVFLPMLASVVVAPVLATPVFAAAAVLIAEFAARRPPIRVVFNATQFVVALSLSILALHPIAGWVGGGNLGETAPGPILALIVCALVFHGINMTAVAGAIALDSNQRFGEVWTKGAARTIAYDVMALPVVFLLAWGYQQNGGPALVLSFVLPVFGLRQLYKKNWELERANEELLQTMVRVIEASNPYTSGHSRRVSLYAVSIGRALRLSAGELERLRIAGLLHDVGKIHEEFAPLLRKQGDLTIEERRLMQMHPIRSAELVSTDSRLKPIIPALRSHHERWDGAGYPDRLSGDQIPLYARIIAVADTVDAMTSNRPYRRALDIDSVKSELFSCGGQQFDPQICHALLKPEAWADFALLVETSRPERGTERVDTMLPPHSRRRGLARVLGLA